VSLDEAATLAGGKSADMLALDDALNSLAEFDPRKSQIVELRYFGGLNIEETAEIIGVSPATVKREWSTAKIWLHREITSAA
jgi:RNA polymerase sigma factor (sigma-70 family)